jgi:hypothetical protein
MFYQKNTGAASLPNKVALGVWSVIVWFLPKRRKAKTRREISRAKKSAAQSEVQLQFADVGRNTALKALRYQLQRLSEGKEPHPFQALRCRRHTFAARCPEAAVSRYPRRSDGDR